MLIRFVLIAVIAITLSSCDPYGRGKVLFTEDTKDRYVVIREDPGHAESCNDAHDDPRPDLPHLREVRGDLKFIFSVLHSNPRIVVEAKDLRSYQVVYHPWDSEKVTVVAKLLGLVVVQEERAIDAITIREAPLGHRLTPAAEGKQADVARVVMRGDEWPLDGVTLDELARFLEGQYNRPVVNLTSVEGRWSMRLSAEAVKKWPGPGKMKPLDETGLDLRWERVTTPVTVVKDKPNKETE
jgi:Protein of unknown function (DUF3738)